MFFKEDVCLRVKELESFSKLRVGGFLVNVGGE